MPDIIVPKLRSILVKRDGRDIVLIEEGKLALRLPWMAADGLCAAIKAKCREAEEEEKAVKIIGDNAVLFRAGFPLGLTRRFDMIKETIKEAVHNRDLRRFMPGGVKSKGIVGTPTIRKLK